MSESEPRFTLDDLRASLDAFRGGLPATVDSAERGYKSQLTFEVHVAAELAAYRTLDLAEAAYALLSQGHVVAAVLTLRAAAESLAWLIGLSGRVRAQQDCKSLRTLKDRVHRLMEGTRIDALRKQAIGLDTEVPLDALNALTVVDEACRTYPRFRRIYDYMSEFCHPGAFGTSLAYSQRGKDKSVVAFSETTQLSHSGGWAEAINICMHVASECYRALHAALPEFAKQCDALQESEG